LNPEERIPGDPASFTISPAGFQAEIFTSAEKGQARAPEEAITSNIPFEDQITGTIFDEVPDRDPAQVEIFVEESECD